MISICILNWNCVDVVKKTNGIKQNVLMLHHLLCKSKFK